MSFQVSLENCQGLRIPDRGGKFIPPARNGEWKCSGTWFCASLWWHHEASLTSRSQVSGGDVDRHRWVEVGGCWACGCSKCKHQCLELDVSCYREPVQGDKERCDIGPFGLKANHGAAFWIICKGLIVHDGSLARRASQSPSLEITRAWTRSCAVYSVRKSLIFLMLCNENLQDQAVFAIWSLKVSWSLKITPRFLTELDGVIVNWIYLDGKIML